MIVMAIDPGTEMSGWVVWDGKLILKSGESKNEDLKAMLDHICTQTTDGLLVIEWITGYGIPAGRETFETCRWVGRFEEKWPGPVYLLPRQKVKQHFQALNDKFIRQALIDRIGPQGTKKNPGPLFGITGHKLSALAVAVAYYDMLTNGQNKGVTK